MPVTHRRRTALMHWLVVAALLTPLLAPAGAAPIALAATVPASVTIAGDLDHTIGCSGDWDPACPAAHLVYDATDDVWQQSWSIPAGAYQYKAALNDGWTESYGLNTGGNNIPLNLGAAATVKFYYDHKTHWVTDNHNSVIVTAAGSFQSELGCGGDWDPSCLRSWLEDPTGSGTYSFVTTALPAGNYEAKAAINESWNENYGQGGAPGGANIAFTVPVSGAKVTFTYNAVSHVLTILAGHAHDNNVEWDGLRHDSRDTLYRAPGGAVPAGTPVKLRFRTFHDDVTGVQARLYDVNLGAQSLVPMSIAASNVSCAQPGLESERCDYWETTLNSAAPDNFWYRFIVNDGTKTAYYEDDTAALDGGLGSPSADPIDNSYALMFYDPAFQSPSWASRAVIYQIFPDRFRNGRANNDPKTGDIRYDDPVLKLLWGVLPEGYCRNYADAASNCPSRFPFNPLVKETPRGRDYYGGDLKGVDQQLPYLKSLGVNTLYFNPLFASGSNHGYDTRDYRTINPYFGTEQDWENLVRHSRQLGIRILLDGVFNHLSSDSAFFDRYHHYATVGACESATSKYRGWFTFHDVAAGTGSCVDSHGQANSATYDGWFGFDSIPVLNKANPDVQKYFIAPEDSVAAQWLDEGASGWRLDVMGDSSFPAGYWETFRQTVKQTASDALIVGELWQKDSTLLSFLRGGRADTTMNYRLRDAVIGFLAPQNFDSKGFADSGHPISATQFANRLASQREDYPDAAYYSLMNLVDSHDTERVLWTLTPGAATTADKELNAANVAQGKLNQRLASLIQFTVPGAPTVYYGDEVGLTGADDPDDRRTYPWADLGGQPDTALFAHYQALAALRRANQALTAGDFRVLFTNDASATVAYGRKTNAQAALIVINHGSQPSTSVIPAAGFLPDGSALKAAYGVGANPGPVTVANGQMTVALAAQSAWIFLTDRVNLTAPAAPAGLQATEGDAQVGLTWQAAPQAASYNVYRSPVSGGGYVKVNAAPVTGLAYTDTGLTNAQKVYYVVTAVNAASIESGWSNEVSALPHLTIGWANLQWPPTLSQTISTINRTGNVYGQVWINGVTQQPGQTPTLRAQLGFGPAGSQPANNAAWTWVEAGFNTDAGNNDEFVASLLPESVGVFDYVYRYSTTNGRDWLYADQNGPIAANALPSNPGKLTVNSSGDTTAPATPTGLMVTGASPAGITLAWNAVTGDPTLYGYEVLRASTAGGPYTLIAQVTAASYTDANVVQDAVYYYVVRSLDFSFNRSGNSAEVQAKAALRTVTLTFNVTVPASTDASGRSVYIAGFLDRLDGGLPQWNPGGVVLTRVDATHWTITLTGKETTQIEYKYTLGDWDHVEKDNVCGEIGNRLLTLSYGASGVQIINDTVQNWRNVLPCGN